MPTYPLRGSAEHDSMHGKARRTDPSTSHTAAVMVDAKGQRDRIVRLLQITHDDKGNHAGMTADMIDDIMGWRVTTAGRRLSELRRAGRVETCGERHTRSGRPAKVYRVVG